MPPGFASSGGGDWVKRKLSSDGHLSKGRGEIMSILQSSLSSASCLLLPHRDVHLTLPRYRDHQKIYLEETAYVVTV